MNTPSSHKQHRILHFDHSAVNFVKDGIDRSPEGLLLSAQGSGMAKGTARALEKP